MTMLKFIVLHQWNFATGDRSNAGIKAGVFIVEAKNIALAKEAAQILSPKIAKEGYHHKIATISPIATIATYVACKEDGENINNTIQIFQNTP